jgi:palmitoyltransferase
MQILFTSMVSVFGRVLVVIVIILIALLGYVGFFVILPNICEIGGIASYFHVINGIFLLYNIYFNYILAVITSPGHPAPELATLIEEGTLHNYKHCKKCDHPKPPRTHHCSVCRKCILKMDHHCPYISNCVGHLNYRYFFCFLLWTFVGTLYLSVLSGNVLLMQTDLIFRNNAKSNTAYFRHSKISHKVRS